MTRILLIDDEAAVRSVVKSMLEQAGFEIVAAESGLGGIQAVQASRFDLAIVDIFMPGMDGLETIKALKARAPTLQIVAMSGFRRRDHAPDGPDFLAMAVKLGAAHSLQKPFGQGELMQAVRTCLGPGSIPDKGRVRVEHASERTMRSAGLPTRH